MNKTLKEYQDMTSGLKSIRVFGECCDKMPHVIVAVEPLAGRSTLNVSRSCIVECETCETRYVSQYD